MAGRRVVLVEDDARVREVLAAYLAVDGWTVTEAADGREGLAAVTAVGPDLIVSDIMMPNLDGLAMVRHLREQPEFRTVPILLISGYADPGIDYEASGPIAYLAKPVTLSAFLSAVRDLFAAT